MYPHAALILTAILKADFEFNILDANVENLTEDQCISFLKDFSPDIVLISALSVEYYQQYHLAGFLAKKVLPCCITVMGGVYPTVLSREILKDINIDYIFIRHAEERLTEFLNMILRKDEKLQNFPGIGFRDKSGNVIINPIKTYISDIKSQVKPDYSMIDINTYSNLQYNSKDYQYNTKVQMASIITSYGCPYNCIFCATRTINGRKIVFRPAEDVIEEIELLIKQYGIKTLLFVDDCLLADKKRIYSILQTFIDRNYQLTWKALTVCAWHLDNELLELMKKSGCTQITISVESGSTRVLKDIIRKPLNLDIIPGIVNKCKELEIDIGANFVIGFPGETWEDLRETFKFAETCNFDLAHFHIATPLPDTDLYKVAKEKNLLPEDFSFTDPNYFGFGRGFIKTDEFTTFELMVLRSFEWDRINFSNEEKTKKIARMMNLTMEELNLHRKNTRANCGIHF
jgi:radical SAM superfamily enzyme YgiQ (UPF0313 family)